MKSKILAYDSTDFSPIRRYIKPLHFKVPVPLNINNYVDDKKFITIVRTTKSTIKMFSTYFRNNKMTYGSHHSSGCSLCCPNKKRIHQDQTNINKYFNRTIKEDSFQYVNKRLKINSGGRRYTKKLKID